MTVNGDTITQKDLDVWKAAIIGRVSSDAPKSTEKSRRAFRYLSLFCILGMLNTFVMLFIGKVRSEWYLIVFAATVLIWAVTTFVLHAYWRQRLRDEQVRAVLQFALDDLCADTALEIEFYERSYDIYITPKRRDRAAIRAASYEKRMTREKYDRLREKIRRERIMRLSKMMRNR